MKTRIIVEGKYNDAIKIKNLLGNSYSSEFHYKNYDDAKSKLDSLYESLSKGDYKFINRLSSTLMYNDAKATIKEY